MKNPTPPNIISVSVPTASGVWRIDGTPSQLYSWLLYNECNGYYMQEPFVKQALLKATGFDFAKHDYIDPHTFGLVIDRGWEASW